MARARGGIYGAGYGIALDPDENVWLSSFGFQGPLIVDGPIRDECPINNEALAVSVSRFTAAGQRRSPDGNPLADQPGGFQVPPRDGSRMRQPQGIKADAEGNLWVAGCVDGTVTRFNAGSPVDPSYMKVSDNANVDSFNNAFDVAIDGRGHAWVTATGTSTVVEIDRDFQVVNYLDENLNKPMGIASDSAGNLWVSNAAQPNPPCPPKLGWDPLGDIGDDNRDGLENLDASVSLIDNSGDTPKVTEFGRDGLTRIGLRWPWGMAVDGRDNAWVANFAGQRIMHLCGAQQARCPAGKVTGDPISPDNGYFFNGLQRVTGIQIDPSGNVWAANNWINEAFMFPENPGGDHMVVFVGLAGPVRTPLIGPPQQP